MGDKVLTLDELNESIPDELVAADSTELANSLIQSWINEELVYEKAKYNLGASSELIEKQVASYRKELFIFEYEKQQVHQKLDTTISEREIIAFYDENQESFQLNDYILKVRYVKLQFNSPDLTDVEQWLQSADSVDRAELTNYCHSYAVKYYDDTSWIYLNELLRELPIEVYNKESFLRTGNLVKFQDDEHQYLLFIEKIQSKNTLSPLELERDRIKNLILNRRKLELLSSIRTSLYKEGISKRNVVRYDKPQIQE